MEMPQFFGQTRDKVRESIKKLDKPKLQLSKTELV
jgi:hypothetical protein